MDYIIYGVFTFSMLCFPAYFLMLFIKKRKEQKEQYQQQEEQNRTNSDED